MLGAGSLLVVGIDLVKDEETLNRAYNDAEGVTARFNLNLLARMNRELGADFDLAAFEHNAFFNREKSRIEMHLASTKRQTVRINGAAIDFRAGETIHTENSYKYTVKSFRALARKNGWSPVKVFTDGFFSVHVLRATGRRIAKAARLLRAEGRAACGAAGSIGSSCSWRSAVDGGASACRGAGQDWHWLWSCLPADLYLRGPETRREVRQRAASRP